MADQVKEILSKLTLEEKAGLCSGADVWRTKTVERLGVSAAMLSDGPHGLRTQKAKTDSIMEQRESIEAVCFPTGSCLACSFDRSLLHRVGEILGGECRAEGVDVILGPAVNSKRSPLCGRNFEYYSEDPFLTAQMASNFIQGVQSRGVGTSLKHFAANNQEYRRMSTSANIDERTLREIYLAGFEGAVKEGKPWTVMCSYNRVNGLHASENKWLLTEILRDDWGFDGLVMSDWGAVNDRVKGLEAGLDLEMPGSGDVNDSKIVKAVREGRLSEEVVDRAAERVLRLVFRAREEQKKTAAPVFDREADSSAAREAARDCMVLLKNEDHLLPLSRKEKVAFIGEFAMAPRYQGGGSSHVRASRVVSALETVKGKADVVFARGYDTSNEKTDETQIAEAVETAKACRTAVIFAGLPESYESEGGDRQHMRLPENQNRLIKVVCEAQPNTVVVLHNGSPVEMPWAGDVKAILEAYLGGQESGGAVADLLYGDANPSGKLAETFPIKLSDNPSYLNFPGTGDECDYREGVFTGYRYYDAKEMNVLFPFGHGLSYTEFAYEDLKLGSEEIADTDTLKVSVTVRNTGKVFGKEVVQLYVSERSPKTARPRRELKGFEKVALEPGEAKTVVFELDKRSFAWYDAERNGWRVDSGIFDILVGSSSRDIRLSTQVRVRSTDKVKPHFTMNSTVADIMAYEPGKTALLAAMSASGFIPAGAGAEELMAQPGMFEDMPLRVAVMFTKGAFSEKAALTLLDGLNG